MAIKILGENTKEQFLNNSWKFKEIGNFYKQTLNPSVEFTDNKEEVQKVKDVLAVERNNDGYIILEYEGSNLISEVEKELIAIK